MLKSLRKFIDSVGSQEPAPRFAETDHRLAAAALLVHAISVDGVAGDSEKAMLTGLLQRQFSLSETETAELIAEARARDRDAVDLYGFTSVIKRRLDEEGRLRVIGMMWQMAFADGAVSEFEDNLVWRVAELIGVSTRDRVALRKQVEAALVRA